MPRRPLHETLAALDAGYPVRIPMSRAKAVGMLAMGLVIGLVLLGLLALMVSETDSPLSLLLNVRVWAILVGIVGCLVLVPVAMTVQLARREALVITREGVSETRGDTLLAVTAWQDITHVDTTMVRSGIHQVGTRFVIYTMTPPARERIERHHAAHGGRPPWMSRGRPGAVLVRRGYVMTPTRLAELLEAARRRYS